MQTRMQTRVQTRVQRGCSAGAARVAGHGARGRHVRQIEFGRRSQCRIVESLDWVNGAIAMTLLACINIALSL